MPKAFNDCRKAGGKIRTITGPSKRYKLAKGEYRHICIRGDKVVWGEKHKKEKSSS